MRRAMGILSMEEAKLKHSSVFTHEICRQRPPNTGCCSSMRRSSCVDLITSVRAPILAEEHRTMPRDLFNSHQICVSFHRSLYNIIPGVSSSRWAHAHAALVW